jgi:hypothetical protein
METRKRKNLQFALHAHACSLAARSRLQLALHAQRDPLRDEMREVGRGLSLADTQTGRVCVFITAKPSTICVLGEGGDIGGHVLRETTSRGLCGLVSPSRTSERGGEGGCVKEGGGGEGKCERESSIDMYNNDVGKRVMK